MLGAVGLSSGLVMKLICVLGHQDFQVLKENHPGAVSSKLGNISSLPIWHCSDLKWLFPLEGESGLRIGMFAAAFLIKILLFYCSPCVVYWCLVK